jgi:hypothetical protein
MLTPHGMNGDRQRGNQSLTSVVAEFAEKFLVSRSSGPGRNSDCDILWTSFVCGLSPNVPFWLHLYLA